MTKDEIKNRISMELKDPILQQGFEIICKNLAELEKHNEELIALINAERERQEKCDDVHLRKIAELEKENAELKDDKMVMADNYSKMEQKFYDNLAKAKEHIKRLLDCLQQDTNDPQTNYYVVQYMTQAEQFLNGGINEQEA